jgi:hypothetical protein
LNLFKQMSFYKIDKLNKFLLQFITDTTFFILKLNFYLKDFIILACNIINNFIIRQIMSRLIILKYDFFVYNYIFNQF